MARVPRLGPRLMGLICRLGAKTPLRWAMAPLALALWLGLADSVALLLEPDLGAGEALRAGLVAIGFGLLALLPVAALSALLGWAVARQRPDRLPLSARLWAFLWRGEAADQVRRVGGLLALCVLAVVLGGLSFLAVRDVAIDMAQPRFIALTVLAIELSLLIVAAMLFPSLRDVFAVLAGALCRLRPLSLVFGHAGGALIALVLGGGAMAVFVAWVNRETLSYLPWALILAGLAGATAALVQALLGPRLPRPIVGALALIGVTIAAVALASSFSLDPSQPRARRLATRDTLLGRTALPLLHLGLDFDRDGHLSLLGERDCAPFDASRGPGAVDVPDNGIDEDCDGRDLDGKSLAVRTRSDWPVPSSVPRRPPVVLITVDAFAAGRMRALGEKRSVTPKIDALAKRSAFFPNCFSQGPSTRLSFPSLFTSRWDSEIERKLEGKHPYPIGKRERLLAEELSGAGYRTVAVLPDAYFGRRKWPSLTRGFSRVVDRPYRQGSRHNSKRVTDEAIAVLREKGDKPLFLWAHYYDAHSPHVQPVDVEVFGTSRADVYDAELKLVDREVGRLVAAVDRQMRGKALVVLTADHGIGFDAPRHEKLNYGYDLHTVILHVPLIVHAPFVRRARNESIVSTMDVAPTLANLLRLGRRGRYRGASLVPELLRGERSRPQHLVHQFYIQERKWKGEEPLEMISLRTERYNLILDRRDGSHQLYDWRQDYYEVDDLAYRPEAQSTFQALKQQLGLFMYRLIPPTERAESAEIQRMLR